MKLWLRVPGFAAVALLAILFFPAVADETELSGEELEAVVASLEIQQEMDRRLLLADRQRYSDLLRRRKAITRRLDALYTRLDDQYERLIQGDLQAAEAFELQDQLAQLEVSVEQGETERDRVRQESWLLRDKMRERGLRLTMLGARLDSLRATTVSRRGALTGRWVVKLLPANVEGLFVLRQEGTIISGRYRLGAERAGSFTGTVIGSRITMQQIDAKYGKDAVFYGTLTRNGDIEGTWESLTLGTGRPSFGTFKAVRAPDPDDSPAPAPTGEAFEDPSARTPLPGGP